MGGSDARPAMVVDHLEDNATVLYDTKNRTNEIK